MQKNRIFLLGLVQLVGIKGRQLYLGFESRLKSEAEFEGGKWATAPSLALEGAPRFRTNVI